MKMAEGLTRLSTGATTLQLTPTNFTSAAADLAAGRGINVEGPAAASTHFTRRGDGRLRRWVRSSSGGLEVIRP